MSLLATMLMGCGQMEPSAPSAPVASPSSVRRPNIVLVLLDDLDYRTARFMPVLREVPHVEFTRAFVTTAVCGPSRASILSGQYARQHRVISNDSAFQAFDARTTIATLLKGAGYRTILVGKYLHHSDRDDVGLVPPGWDSLAIPSPPNHYYEYWLNTFFPPSDFYYGHGDSNYLTNVLAARALQETGVSGPSFRYVAPIAPHLPAYAPALSFEEARSIPTVDRSRCSYNEAEQFLSTKPGYVRQRLDPIYRFSEADHRLIEKQHRMRHETLFPVSRMIADLVKLPDTYVFVTSDNGWMAGEHRFLSGKNVPYEESIRAPLYVFTPDRQSRTVSNLVSTVDLSATFLDLAGISVPDHFDGRSLVPLLQGQQPAWRDAVLSESLDPNSGGADPYSTLRSVRWMYTEYRSGERELYDMDADPNQCSNIIETAPASLITQLSQRLAQLSTCRGASCRN
jgi:N-acetylglucosamine-6-sulfatase